MTKLALVIGVLVLATLLVLGVLWLVKNTQRFVSAGAPPESELTAWIAAHSAEVAALAPAEATRIARERIAQARRADLISDWLADVRRRVDVVRFAPPGGLRR